jgi:hypothetical protein
MASEKPSPMPPVDDAAERAARIKAMLARWQAEDVSSEPHWDLEDIEPLRLDPKPRVVTQE